MIYCVVPRELSDELYERLIEYYADNPNVTVILDRREGPERRQGTPTPDVKERREIRDRRRPRVTGTFPEIDALDD